MKKSVVAVAAAVAALAGLHRFAPSLARRAMQHCHQLFMRAADEPPCDGGCAGSAAATA